MNGYFISATGTGVGKTFTTCALLHAARAKDLKVQGFKPVISGWSDLGETDTAQIIQAQAYGEVHMVSPWRFEAPLSPHRAAALEHEHIDVEGLVEWTRAQAAQNELTLIETVGGIMVPLNEESTTLDWMKQVGLPVILVTGSYLGTISHTLTALAVLQQAGIPVKALIVNESENAMDFAEARAGLESSPLNIPLRIFQPRVSSWKDATEISALLAQL